MEDEWNPGTNCPAGVDDPKCHRTLVHFAKRAIRLLSKALWPGEAGKAHCQAARRQLDQYVDQVG
eukprot:3204149-Lingulodinium_polyedra.AAC.1